MSQAAGQVKILIFLVNFISPIYANNFCDAGQVPILKYFEACKVQIWKIFLGLLNFKYFWGVPDIPDILGDKE